MKVRLKDYSSKPIKQESVQKQPPEVFFIKSVLKNIAKFTGKHLFQGLFFNKVERDSGKGVSL